MLVGLDLNGLRKGVYSDVQWLHFVLACTECCNPALLAVTKMETSGLL